MKPVSFIAICDTPNRSEKTLMQKVTKADLLKLSIYADNRAHSQLILEYFSAFASTKDQFLVEATCFC